MPNSSINPQSSKEQAAIPPNDGESLSEAYRKVRRFYGLAAGLLLGWEFVGLSLVADSPIETAIGTWTIKAPESIPIVLLALLAYSAYRLYLEFNLSFNPNGPLQRQDYYSSHVLGLFAVFYWAVQTTFATNIADQIASTLSEYGTSAGVVLGGLVGTGALIIGIRSVVRANRAKNELIEEDVRALRQIEDELEKLWTVFGDETPSKGMFLGLSTRREILIAQLRHMGVDVSEVLRSIKEERRKKSDQRVYERVHSDHAK